MHPPRASCNTNSCLLGTEAVQPLQEPANLVTEKNPLWVEQLPLAKFSIRTKCGRVQLFRN